jgi:hypothetical protein
MPRNGYLFSPKNTMVAVQYRRNDACLTLIPGKSAASPFHLGATPPGCFNRHRQTLPPQAPQC